MNLVISYYKPSIKVMNDVEKYMEKIIPFFKRESNFSLKNYDGKY